MHGILLSHQAPLLFTLSQIFIVFATPLSLQARLRGKVKELLTGMGMGLEELQEEEDKGLEEGEEGGEGLPMDLDEGAAVGPGAPGGAAAAPALKAGGVEEEEGALRAADDGGGGAKHASGGLMPPPPPLPPAAAVASSGGRKTDADDDRPKARASDARWGEGGGGRSPGGGCMGKGPWLSAQWNKCQLRKLCFVFLIDLVGTNSINSHAAL